MEIGRGYSPTLLLSVGLNLSGINVCTTCCLVSDNTFNTSGLVNLTIGSIAILSSTKLSKLWLDIGIAIFSKCVNHCITASDKRRSSGSRQNKLLKLHLQLFPTCTASGDLLKQLSDIVITTTLLSFLFPVSQSEEKVRMARFTHCTLLVKQLVQARKAGE